MRRLFYMLWVLSISVSLLYGQEKGKVKFQIQGVIEDLSIYAKTKIVKLKNLRASEVEPFIRTRLSSYGAVQVNDITNEIIITDREPKLTDLVNLVKKLDEDGIKKFVHLETDVLYPRYVKPSKLLAVVEKNLSPEGSAFVDDELNAVIVTDVRSKIDRIREIMGILDRPAKQLWLEAKFVTIDKQYLKEIGFDLNELLHKLIIRGSYIKEVADKTGHEHWMVGVTLAPFWDIIEQAVQSGKADIKTLPRCVVLNENKVTLRYQDVMLELTPHIGDTNCILMDVKFGLMQQVESKSKYISTTLIAKEDTPFVVGGIDYTITSENTTGIPILSWIPIIGYLFKREVATTTDAILLAIVTPRILEFGELPEGE